MTDMQKIIRFEEPTEKDIQFYIRWQKIALEKRANLTNLLETNGTQNESEESL